MFPLATTTACKPLSCALIAMGSTPLTRRHSPSRDSSLMNRYLSSPSVGITP